MKKFFRKFRKNLRSIKNLITTDEYLELLKYFLNVIKQNIKIRLDYLNYINNGIKSSVTRCRKGDIFWVDFGYGIGNEFRYPHYCVVLAVENNNVIVIPFTSNSKRLNQSKMVINLGVIEKIQVDPNNPKESYALVHSIRSINRTRLIRPRINGKIVYPKLDQSLMSLIKNNINQHL